MLAWCRTVHYCAFWCNQRGPGMARKRYSVSIEIEDYERLKELAEGQKPRLTLQYLTEYAIRLLLERVEDPQFRLELRDPVSRS